jgi:hypothetical protein
MVWQIAVVMLYQTHKMPQKEFLETNIYPLQYTVLQFPETHYKKLDFLGITVTHFGSQFLAVNV